MTPYLEAAKKSFQRHLAYRAANIAGIITNAFFGAIYIFIYLALFRERAEVGGLGVDDAVAYVVVSQALLMAMSAFGNRELSEAIIRGDIVVDLSRPVDFYALWAALDLGRAVYYLFFRGVPTFLIGWALFRPRLPAHLATWGWFLACIAVGMVVSFAFRFVIDTLAFWTTDARGLQYFNSVLIIFFAGFIVPLNFFPAPLRAVAEVLPFRALAHLPISVYLGKESGIALARALALQVAWAIALVALGRLMLRLMMRRLSVHGG